MQKYADLDADLISASVHGPAHVHSVIFKKLAEIIKEPEDLDCVLGALTDLRIKTAAPGDPTPGYDVPKSTPTLGGSNALRNVAIGALLAAPAMAGGKWLLGKYQKEQGWNNLMDKEPELIASNPERAEAIYNLIHSSAPHIATNTPIAADIMKQMMAMPQVDLGTVGGMANIHKGFTGGEDKTKGLLENMGQVPAAMVGYHSIITGYPKAASHIPLVSPNHIAKDGTLCILDWSTPACKAAGLTDAFTGSGMPLDQANAATQFGQDSSTMLPLDSVVRELLNKETELAQRQQVMQEQEQQLQQAMQQIQQMQQGYQQQTGVNPQSGEPAEHPSEESAASPAEEDSQADANNEPVPPEEAQAQAKDMGEANFEEAQGNAIDEQSQGGAPEASGESDSAEQADPGGEAAGDSKEDTGAQGVSEEEQGQEQPPLIMPRQNSPEEDTTAQQEMAQQAQPMPPADEVQDNGESSNQGESSSVPAEASVPSAPEPVEPAESTEPAKPDESGNEPEKGETPPAEGDEGGEEGATPAEVGEKPTEEGKKDELASKGEDVDEGKPTEGAPVEGDSIAEVPTEGAPVEGDSTAEVPAEGAPAEVPAEGAPAEVPAEGAPAEVPAEGAPAEETHEEGVVPATDAEPAAGTPAITEEIPNNVPATPSPAAVTNPMPTAPMDGSTVVKTINIPIQIAVKVGEKETPSTDTKDAYAAFHAVMSDLFRPSKGK